MSFDEYLRANLGGLAESGLLRVEALPPHPGAVDACSNDYLGVSVSRATLGACSAEAGAGASRLIYGSRVEHLELESAAADWVDMPQALLFSSGYAANLGLVSALSTEDVLVVSDALNHASIIDGCRLGRGRVVVTPHLDLDATERALANRTEREAIVVCESYFSMDGDSPDLAQLDTLTQAHRAALLVDEAHALGIFGEEGAGLCSLAGVRPTAIVGTLGKAVGAQGAFVAGSEILRNWLWNRARSLVYSTAPSPALTVLSHAQLQRVRADNAARTRLHLLSDSLRHELAQRGLESPAGNHGPIVPVLTGSAEAARRAEAALADQGIRARAIRPPTVPAGGDRVRLTVHANWPADLPATIAEVLADQL